VADALEELDRDQTIRCIVITGVGEKAFAAGADIKEMSDKSPIDMMLGRFEAWKPFLRNARQSSREGKAMEGAVIFSETRFWMSAYPWILSAWREKSTTFQIQGTAWSNEKGEPGEPESS